jgi:hypothetical protein
VLVRWPVAVGRGVRTVVHEASVRGRGHAVSSRKAEDHSERGEA